MSVAELLPQIRALCRKDQLQLVHCLVDELAEPEPTPQDRLMKELADGGPYDVFSPELGEGAAEVLMEFLKTQAPPR